MSSGNDTDVVRLGIVAGRRTIGLNHGCFYTGPELTTRWNAIENANCIPPYCISMRHLQQQGTDRMTTHETAVKLPQETSKSGDV